REKSFVLEVDVVEPVPVPQFPQTQYHERRILSDPFAPVHERVRTECTTEVAALRGDVIQLPFALELEIALDRYQPVVVRAKHIEWPKLARRILADGPVCKPHGASCAALQRATFGDEADRFLGPLPAPS